MKRAPAMADTHFFLLAKCFAHCTRKKVENMITHYIHKKIVASAIWTHASMSPFFFVNKLEYCSFLNGNVIDRINKES